MNIMTKISYFEMIKNAIDDNDVQTFCDAEIARLKTKQQPTIKPISKHENDKMRVLSILTKEPQGLSDIWAQLEDMSAQRMTAILIGLANEGKAKRTTYKRRAYFQKI